MMIGSTQKKKKSFVQLILRKYDEDNVILRDTQIITSKAKMPNTSLSTTVNCLPVILAETIHMYRQLVLQVCNNTISFSYSTHCFWLLAEGANNTCPHPNAKGWAISLSHKHSTEAQVTNANAYIYTKHCIRFETHSALVHKLSSSFPLSHSLYI